MENVKTISKIMTLDAQNALNNKIVLNVITSCLMSEVENIQLGFYVAASVILILFMIVFINILN